METFDARIMPDAGASEPPVYSPPATSGMTCAEYLEAVATAESTFSGEIEEALSRQLSAAGVANGNAQVSANEFYTQYHADTLAAYSVYQYRESQAISTLWLAVENATAGLVGGYDLASMTLDGSLASAQAQVDFAIDNVKASFDTGMATANATF